MSKQEGILLFECLLAMAITVILFSVLMPGVKAWAQRQHNAHVVDRLKAFLFRARYWAMTHQQALRCCGSKNGQQCDGAWSKGWLIKTLAGKRLYYKKVSFPSVTWHQGHLGQASSLVYSAQGELASSPGHFEWRSFKQKQYLYVSGSGRARIGLHP